jgi:hypothetical protein
MIVQYGKVNSKKQDKRHKDDIIAAVKVAASLFILMQITRMDLAKAANDSTSTDTGQPHQCQ